MKSNAKYPIIAVMFFYLANIVITYYATTSAWNPYITSFERGIGSELCAILGNASIITLLLMIIFSLLKKTNSRVITMGIISIGLGIVVFALRIYTKYYQTAFSFRTLSVFKNPAANLGFSIIMEAVKEFFYKGGFLLILPGIALIIYGIVLGKKKISFKMDNRKSCHYLRISGVITSIFFSLLTVIIFENMAIKDWPYNNDLPLYGVQYCGVYNYYVYEIIGVDFNYDLSDIATEEEALQELNTFNRNNANGKYTNIFDGMEYSTYSDETFGYNLFDGMNVFVLQLESFNNFLVDLEVNGTVVTPNLNELISDDNAYYFSNFYTNSGQGVTADAEMAIMTGINANGASTFHWDYQNTKYDLECLPEMFKNKYTSGVAYSFHSDNKMFYNRPSVHEKLFGFDHYYPTDDFEAEYGDTKQSPDLYINGWAKDEEVLKWSFEHLDDLDSSTPYFWYTITIVSHTPYLHNPHEGEINWGSSVKSQILKRYLSYMNYVDETVGAFYEKAKTMDNTVFLIYGDHGCGINDGSLKSILGDMSSLEYIRTLREIPAIIYDPSGKLNTLMEGNMEQPLVRSQIDLYSTMYNLCGLSTDYPIFGVNAITNERTFAYDPIGFYIFTDNYSYSLKRTSQSYLINLEYDISKQKYEIERIKAYKKYSDLLLLGNKLNQLKK